MTHFLENQGVIHKERGNVTLTESGLESLQSIKTNNLVEILSNLELLSESDVFWVSIKEVNKITNERG